MKIVRALVVLIMIVTQACNSNRESTFTLQKGKLKNHVEVRRIEFVSSHCSSEYPSFQLQIDNSKRILYKGLAYAKRKGYYAGNIDPDFWENLVEKVHYIDLNHFKKFYGQRVKDSQTLKLSIETDRGNYRCTIVGIDKLPSELSDLTQYILNNYSQIEMKPLDIHNMFKPDTNSQQKTMSEILEKIPC